MLLTLTSIWPNFNVTNPHSTISLKSRFWIPWLYGLQEVSGDCEGDKMIFSAKPLKGDLLALWF